MKTQYEIYMDFQNARNQANALRGIAGRLETLANDSLDGTLKAIGQAWSGDNAEKYLAKGDSEKQKIIVTAGDLRKVADTIDRIAQTTYNAELAAMRIATD